MPSPRFEIFHLHCRPNHLQMATATLVLKEPNSPNDTLIYLIIRLDNKRLKYSTGQKINPKYWNSTKQRVKEVRQYPNYPEFNTLLGNFENAALNAYRKILNDGGTPTLPKIKELLDQQFKPATEDQKQHTFFSFLDYYIATTNKKHSTIKSYKTCIRVLSEYQQHTKVPITFDGIDLDFYESFTKYLTERGYFVNTIGNFIKNLKVFMNEAVERGLTQNMTHRHKRFKKPNEASESIFLTTAEIENLYRLELSGNERLQNSRDLFIVGCYTGLRFSDLSRLTDKNITDNGTKLKIQTEKTGELVVIPLHRYIREILERYNGSLPRVISNQKMNEYLKELGELATINENVTIHYTKGGQRSSDTLNKYKLITVHTARRSFATNAYLNNVPSISIMKITGHSTERAFMKYIKISQEDNANKLLNHPFFN
jgi:integrase